MEYLLNDFVTSGANLVNIMREQAAAATSCAIALNLDTEKVRVDFGSLICALRRYARDVFGYQRIYRFIDGGCQKLSMGMAEEKRLICLNLKINFAKS